MTHTARTSILSATAILLALTGCEGEPPKVPENPSPGAEASPAVPATAVSAPPESAAPAPSGAPPMPCAGMGMGSHPATEASATPGAAPAAPAPTPGAAPAVAPAGAAAAPAPAPVTQFTITGTVTTAPAHSGGTSVVYLENGPIAPGKGMSVGVDNRQMNFIPFVQVVTVGGRVLFSNGDPFPHNIFSPDDGRFDLGLVPPHGAAAHTFKTAGVYTLLCNLHPNMIGYVVVSPSTFFAKANAKGEFSLKDVPAGSYKITAWAPRQKPVTQDIVVKDADITTNFELHR
ncbi:MAG TPA: carboxypeptidase regulatory-like domain-containing protein [Polyangiaceae bacterium]